MNSSNNIELLSGKPLLIYGNPGSGKTHLALSLLKDTILLRIDIYQIKELKDVKKYILDRINKRNITLMFQEQKEQRGVLIDDINVFFKHDKSCFKSLMEFMMNGQFYNAKIVLTCCNNFLKNRELCKLKIDRYEINHTYSEYSKICLKLIHSDGLDKRLFSKITNSNYNLNNFLSEYESDNHKFMKDNFDGVDKITEKIIKDKLSVNEIFRLCSGDEKTILLNLLENIDNDHLNIYNFCDTFNRKDIFIYENNFFNIPISLINRTIQTPKTIIYNRYISKNMIKHKNKKNDSLSDKYIYLLDTFRKTGDIKYNNELSIINKKVLKYHVSIYDNLYL